MAVLLLCTLSCSKISNTNTGPQNNDEQNALGLEASATTSEGFFDDAFDLVMQNGVGTNTNPTTVNGPAVNSTVVNVATSDCTTITASPATPGVYPKTITVDYGSGCTKNGITRAGKIIITLTGSARSAGTTITVVFQGYSVNSIALGGGYSLTPALVSGGGVNYTLNIQNATVTAPGSGSVYTYSGTETFTQTAGMSTATIADDSYSITGNITYSGGGVTTTGNITTPLTRTFDCQYITSGVISFSYNNINGTVDFGSGTCDATATVTAGSTSQMISLPGRLNY